ncbi:hypothetical protein NKH18_34770 [Streptomyces sp. M10(2022)]
MWTVPTAGGTPTAWSTAPELSSTGFLGANGAKLHDGALWVTNLDRGTLLRIPVRPGNRAGTPQVKAEGLVGIDDFTFTGRGDVLAALNGPNTVVRIRPDGSSTTVLDAADGLQNPLPSHCAATRCTCSAPPTPLPPTPTCCALTCVTTGRTGSAAGSTWAGVCALRCTYGKSRWPSARPEPPEPLAWFGSGRGGSPGSGPCASRWTRSSAERWRWPWELAVWSAA